MRLTLVTFFVIAGWTLQVSGQQDTATENPTASPASEADGAPSGKYKSHDEAYQAGLAAFKSNRLQDAEMAFRDAAKMKGDFVPARNDLAALLMRQGRYQEGLSHLKFIADTVAPKDPKAHHKHGIALMQVQQIQPGVDALTKAVELAPATRVFRRDLIKALMLQKSFDTVVKVSSEGLAQEETPADLNEHGNVLLRVGRSTEAIPVFEKSLKLNASPETHFNLGLAYFDTWQLKKAEAQLLVALRGNPDNFLARFTLGRILARMKNYDGAVAQLTRALRTQPKYWAASYELGMVSKEQSDFVQAAEHFLNVLKQNPAHARSQYELGACLRQQGKAKEAVAQLREAVLSQPLPEVQFELARAYEDMGDEPSAIRHYRQAILMRPDWPAPRNAASVLIARQPSDAVETKTADVQEMMAKSTKDAAKMWLDTLIARAATNASRGEKAKAKEAAQAAVAWAKQHGLPDAMDAISKALSKN